MKAVFYSLLLIVAFNSCDTDPNELPGDKPTLNESADDKFVGVWDYFPVGPQKDNSMEGQLGTLKILDGTKETYTFEYLNSLILFSKRDDSTLEGVSTKCTLKIIGSNQHLKFNLGEKSMGEFRKLK
jgi:hypothetical protein